MKSFDYKSGIILYEDFWLVQSIPLSQQIEHLHEDLFLVKYGENYLMDLGWYPEHDINGSFLLQIIFKEHWDKPILYSRCKTVSELKNIVNNAICFAEALL